MVHPSRVARLFALPFHLAFCLAILRFLASAAPPPRAERAACELRPLPRPAAEHAPFAPPLAPLRRSRSGMLAPSTRLRTWRPRRRPHGPRRPMLRAVNVRRLFAPRRGSRGPIPPPPGPPPPPSDPDAGLLYLLALAPFIVRMLQRFRVPGRDLEDVAQHVLIAAHRRWGAFEERPGSDVRSARRRWIFTIAWRLAAAYHASAQIRPALLPPDDRRLDPRDYDAPDVDRRLDAARALDSLTEPHLATTPDRWRIFVAFEVDGSPLHAIAKIEGLSVPTVANRLRAARLDLRAALFRRGIKGPGV